MANAHKKGEDVVNNFGRTLKNARGEVDGKVKSAVTGFSFAQACPRTERLITGFDSDPVITNARAELRAEPSGVMNDQNSQAYGDAARKFQAAMSEMGGRYADAVKHFKHGKPNEGNRGLNQAAAAKNKAIKAWQVMCSNGYDPIAAHSLLTQTDVNPDRLKLRKKLLQDLQGAMVYFSVRGKDICDCMLDELVAYLPAALLKASRSR